MANETTITSLTEIVPAEKVGQIVIEYARAQVCVGALAHEVKLPMNSGKVYNFPRWVGPDAHEDITTEGTTTLSNNELETLEVSVTVAQIGLLREVTKLAARTQALGPALLDYMMQDAATVLALAIEDDLVALFSSITNSVGTTTVDLSIANMLQAIAKHRAGNSVGQLEFVLHDQQLADLNAAIAASGATFWSAGANQSTLNGTMGALAGRFLDINVWYSTLCDTANSGEDRVGALFVNGRQTPTRAALGLVMFWFAEMEQDVDIAKLTNKFAWSACYGQGLVGDAYACKIVTDA